MGKRTQMESNDIFKIIVEVYFGILLQNKNTTPGQPACQFALLPVSFFPFFPSHYVQNSEFCPKISVPNLLTF